MAAFSEKKIRESLEEQLRAKGADCTHFRELIDAYLYFYKLEKDMRANVKTNGLFVQVMAASGELVDKENPCIKNAAAYNKQRLTILKELGLSTSNVRVISAEDSDL